MKRSAVNSDCEPSWYLNWALVWLMIIASSAVGDLGAQAQPAQPRQPNIVFIMADDLGYCDLGCFGSEVIKTPNIDRLAEQGLSLTNFYVHSRCSPTRAAFMTGSLAHRVGIANVIYTREKEGIHQDEVTMAELLQQAGYVTGHIGKWHLGSWPKFLPHLHGFTHTYTITEYTSGDERGVGMTVNGEFVEEIRSKTHGSLTPKMTTKAVEFIREHKADPFFLFYASPIPHTRWQPHDDFEGTSAYGLYGDVVQELDWQVGEIMKEIDNQGLADQTLVIFTSDNGPRINVDTEQRGLADPLRDGKGSDFEGGIRVPAIARWTNTIAAGSTNDEITAITDMLPTFCALAGTKPPSDRIIDGHNILPYLIAEEYNEPIYDTWIVPGSTIRQGRWKYVAQRHGSFLYNLSADIGETTDVSAQHPEIAERLREQLELFTADLEANKRPVGKL